MAGQARDRDGIVRIGCASGFWGDSALAAAQLVRRAEIDYLVFDYLAEVTMSIMARARARDPAAGYATDFVTVVMPGILRDVAAKGVRIVTNAGGVNPEACRAALAEAAAAAGVSLKIAVVLGDDLMPSIGALRDRGTAEMDTGAALPPALLSANAYLGAFPIAAALAAGADVVLTGRCVDSALALGPLIHQFGWAADDWDKLAAGCLAGHLIECGAQATGGLFTDWDQVPDWADIGYPVVECAADGSLVVTKPAGTGGLVAPATVAEQMLYEVGDPAAYLLPDVACDFTGVTLSQDGPARVRVAGARGRPASGSYKACATYLDGYRLSTTLTIAGIGAAAKARATGAALLDRTRAALAARGLEDFDETLIEALGAEDGYGPHARSIATREVVLRLSARHRRREALEILAREAASPVTSMSPGTTGYIGGRPTVQSVIRLFSFLLPRHDVPVVVDIDGARIPVAPASAPGSAPSAEDAPSATAPAEPGGASAAKTPAAEPQVAEPLVALPLIALAHGRSGDKGNSANIAIIARRPEFLPVLRRALTEEAVAGYFRHLCAGRVRRFEVPGVHAFNFLLEEALGGGGVASLRIDPQGKTYAQMLLSLPVEVPVALARRHGLLDPS
jgi:hypothetical protein